MRTSSRVFRLSGPRAAELQRGEPGVEAAASDEIGMGTAVGDAALIEHQDAAGALHGGEAMGDHDTLALLAQWCAPHHHLPPVDHTAD